MSDENSDLLKARCPQCGAGLTVAGCPRCALALASEEMGFDEEELHLIFPELDIIGKIARGGFGTVYRAEHRKLKRPVALKFLDPNIATSKNAVARFEEEMAAVGKLDHPGIVRAHDAGEREGHWYIVMEFVDGESLAALSRRVGKMKPAEACHIVRQAALALAYAHQRGLIHRDVKPGNIMVSVGTEIAPSAVKVLDFGLAASAKKNEDGFSGSPDYAAPEQITMPREVDARADIFGLGATLFRLLTGVPPRSAGGEDSLAARVERIATIPAPPIATICADLPPGLAALCDRMLAMDRDDRPATAEEVAGLLAPFAGVLLPRKRQWPIAAAAVIAASATWLFFPKREPVKPPPPDMQSAVVKRQFKDIGHGLYFFNGTPIGIHGTITGWSFYDARGGPHSVTPVLLDRVDEKTFTLQGIGTSRRSIGSGVQTFAFDLLAGTDKVGPNTCFGFSDRLVTRGYDAGTVDYVDRNSGVVDGEDGGPWLFTHGGRFPVMLPNRIGMQFAVIEGDYTRGDRPLPVNVGRTYSARAIVTPPGEHSPVPPTPPLAIPVQDAMDDDLPPLRDQRPQPTVAAPPSQPGMIVVDDLFDDGVLGTNTTGKGDGFVDMGQEPLVEAGGFLLLDMPAHKNSMAFRCDRANSINPFLPAATRITYTFGKIVRGSGQQRLWIGYQRRLLNTVEFFPGSIDITKRPPAKGLYLSIIAQDRRTDGFANRGNLVAADSASNRTVLASWKWTDPDQLSGLNVRLTTTDTTYRIEFSGAPGGVPVFVKGGPTGPITGLGEPEPGLTYDFGGMNQYSNGTIGSATLDRITVETNVPKL